MKKIKIGDKFIGEDEPVFIIAEVGVNHNGKLDLAKKLIDVAAEAKVDAVKFQTFNPDTLITRAAKRAEYQKKNIGGEETQYEMLKRLMLKREYHPILKKYAEKKGLIFLSTPFSIDDADYLHELGVVAYKVTSTDTNNIPYLRHIAKREIPIILSTGMSDLEEVKESVKAIKEEGNEQIIVLHCTINYPTKLEEVNLRAMDTIKKEVNTIVGFSDHTEGIDVSIAAVGRGAKVIEKHFTLDRNMDGPDHKASLGTEELKKLVNEIRNIEFFGTEELKQKTNEIENIDKILGSDVKKPMPSEVEVAKVIRKSIVAEVDIPKDTLITREMLALKRPGTGIPPKELDKIIGKKTKEDVKKDELISWKKLNI